MASRRPQFQGHICLHETPLTSVISCGEFQAAEQIIEATSDPSFLNDGHYENIPLHMVLTNNQKAKNCRNLRLAQLLVQKGASPNLRISYLDMDGASPSPFEELVVYYELLKAYVAGASAPLCVELEMFFDSEEHKLEFLTNTIDLDNEKCLPNLECCKRLMEQTSDLIDVFLRYGSDPSVQTTFARKSLFHWVIEHRDVGLAKRFLDTSRVNTNDCDAHGTTLLMDAILRNTPENSLTIYEAMRDTADSVNVNFADCCGETALFRAVFVGATKMAGRLCEDGAKVTIDASVSQMPVSTCREQSTEGVLYSSTLFDKMGAMTTPMLASMLADSPVRLRYSHVSTYDNISVIYPHKHLVDKIILASVSPLLDHGYFSDEAVASEVMFLLGKTNFDQLLTTDINVTDMLTLMFGQLSAGLRQLCVRTIFDHSVMVSRVTDKTWPKTMPDVFCSHGCQGTITGDKVKELVEVLGLPHSFQIFFDLEAAKYQMCSLVMKHRSMECDQACSASEESLFDEEDEESYSEFSSVYADSDSLLFFSSDISEESSEEVDDLSDEDFSGSEEEVEEGMNDEVTKQPTSGLKKIKYEPESSASESGNTRVVVETFHDFSEDLPEGAVQDGSSNRCDKYQRLNNESTTSTDSPDNLTASDSISDSLC